MLLTIGKVEWQYDSNVVDISTHNDSHAEIAIAAEAGGADAVAAINTVQGMAIDWRRKKPMLGNVVGGLSGPAIKPIALRMVYEAAHAVEVPVIGIGGISTAEDVIEYLLAGAAAVEVGTASFWDPCATEKIVESLEAWCIEHRVDKITDLIGGLLTS